MPNRYVCDVIKEARACCKTLNFSYLPGLLEEIQTMVNRMEATLEDYSNILGYKSLDVYRQDVRNLKHEIRNLKVELEELKKEKYNLTEVED